MKLLHTCLRVGDLEASLNFYEEALGLIEVKRKDHSEHGFILVYLSDEDENYEIELTYNMPHQVYEIGNGFSHIAVASDDLEKDHARHSEMGYEVTPLKGLPGNPANYYFVTDPDGYKVEIIRG